MCYFCGMKRTAILSFIISVALGIAVGIYDMFNPIVLDENSEWANPDYYESSTDYWTAMMNDAFTWGLATMVISFLVIFILLQLNKKNDS